MIDPTKRRRQWYSHMGYGLARLDTPSGRSPRPVARAVLRTSTSLSTASLLDSLPLFGKCGEMIVSKNRVVSLSYTLTGEDGTVLDSSNDEEPLSYLHGAGSMIEGLETALEGKAPADHVSVTVLPEQAYGARDDSIVFSVPRAQFRGVDNLEIGMQFEVQGDGEGHMVTLIGMDADEVTVDGNHPLAGLTLHFDVDIVEVREATPDEIEHGHPHEGPSSHSH